MITGSEGGFPEVNFDPKICRKKTDSGGGFGRVEFMKRFVENIALALEYQSFKLDKVRPHPSPLPQERVKERPSSNDRISFQQSKMASMKQCCNWIGWWGGFVGVW